MSTVATVSLAIIAATCLVVMGVTIVIAVQVLRALRRVHEAVAALSTAANLALAQARSTIARADHMMDVVTNAHATLQSTMTNIDRVRKTADRSVREFVAPLMGVLGAISSLVPNASHGEPRAERKPRPRADWTARSAEFKDRRGPSDVN